MKKLLVLVFAIALCLGVLCVGASAAEEHDNHSGWTKLMQKDFNTNNASLELESGNYYLGDDVNCTGISGIQITGNVTLCLNGHVLALGAGIITVNGIDSSGLTFTLCDCSSVTTHGYIDSNGLWHNGDDVPEGATECDLTGGVVTGGSSRINGGGVYLYNSTFNMTGGNIAGNTTTLTGGGVYVHNSTFNMTGGTITGNTATNGGGVMVDVSNSNSAFTMNGGTITGNTATNGGGVFVDGGGGTFNLSNSSITGNSATNGSGGGVYVNGGSFTMNDDTNSITNNTAAGNGGGVYVGSGSFNMNNSNIITNNTATGHGGGVYVNSGTFTIGTFSSIANNNATGNGGGVYMNGSGPFTIESGSSIEYNTAGGNGGGVYMNGSAFEIGAGSSISNNTATNGGGVFVNGGSTFTMEDGDITGNKIASNDDSIETYGGGVYVNGGSTFTMEDGDISLNSATNGGGVFVYGGSAFTMRGGGIKNNTADISGGGLWVLNSNFTLSGGDITNNNADKYNGGGAFVIGGTFTMSGGSITGNNAGNLGGGVAINSSFTMSGGTITGNNAGNRGGGVYASVYSYNLSGDQTTVSNGMEFKLSGNPTIKDNTVNKGEPNETTSNVDLNQYYNNQESATVFTIVGLLSGNSPIGVTMDNPGVFTSGWSSYMQGKDPTSYFFSDITGYHVGLDDSEVALVANTYTVVFDANGGTGTMPPQTFTYNTAQNLTANTFTRTGYTVIGWNTAADGTGTPYKEGEQVINLTTEPNGTVTLYAQWTANEYTVTFDPNGGEGIISSQSFTYDTAQKLTGNGFTRTGYTFDGWKDDYGNSYFDEEIVENLTSELNGNVTLYAQWKANSYSVSLNLNGGRFADGAQDVTSYTYGTVTLLPDVTRSGYRFEGWYADEEFQDGPYTEISAADLGNKTFFARWSFINIPDPNGITVTQPANGTVKVNPSNGSAGTLITVTATPDEGYELAYITVDGEKITGNTFRMPDKSVTVSAVFVPATFPFVDVKSGDWFYDYVAYVYANGLMDGTSATTFEPNANMTRAMVWAILARVDGETVTGAAWATDARAWAMAEGVSDGTDPNGLVTREQFATMLYRYAVAKGYDVSIGESTNILSYADFASISEYAIPAMQWACGSGIVTGVTDSTLAPQGTATRAQCAAMLMRFAEL